MLDESTSALQMERTMQSLDRINATYVSVGHRPSLLQYHNKKPFIGPVKAEMSYVDSESLEVKQPTKVNAMFRFSYGTLRYNSSNFLLSCAIMTPHRDEGVENSLQIHSTQHMYRSCHPKDNNSVLLLSKVKVMER